MKVKENVTIYQCEFCKRKMFVKQAMEKHERWCTYNPENFRTCHDCAHLEQTSIEYSWSNQYSDEEVEYTKKQPPFVAPN